MFVLFQKMVTLIIALGCLSSVTEGKSDSLYNLKKIPPKELKKIELFFRYLIWNEQATFGYTLFGEKPLSITCFPKKIPEQLKKARHPMIHLSGWLTSWEKYQNLFELNKYVLFSHESPLAVEIYLLNKDLAAGKIQENLALFQGKLKVDKSPNEILDQLLSSRNFFKKGLNGSHVLFGILLGYGTENSVGYDNYNFGTSETPPTFFDQSAMCNCHSMPLPFFAVFSEKETDELLQSYSLQRRKILRIYSKNNFLKTTLRQLTTDIEKTPQIKNRR